jgi:D-arabinose 1-dehydrogenase-like Zn-dependent alcohol dehydrogenase
LIQLCSIRSRNFTLFNDLCWKVEISTTMKALLLSEYNHLEMKELPNPIPDVDELLIQVAACGICGSDVHGYDGSTGRRIPPIVMGHEAAGIVVAIGSRSTDSSQATGSPSIRRSTVVHALIACKAGGTSAIRGRSSACPAGSIGEQVPSPSCLRAKPAEY